MRKQIELFIAIKTSNIYNVIDVINKNGFNDDYFNGKMTFLSLAIFQGNWKNKRKVFLETVNYLFILYFLGNVDIVNVLLDAGASVNLLSHISHTWPETQLFETFEPSLVTAVRLGLIFILFFFIH